MVKTSAERNYTLMIISLIFITIGICTISSSTAKNLVSSLHESSPRIQLAILLDTSSSMDGLINQARNQLWQAVNEFARAKRNGQNSSLEVAVYEYGNDRLSAKNGYVRPVLGLTRDLDKVSEALFSLTTNGGQEYCGYAMSHATKNLQWSTNDNDIKAIFIAGNEAFSQGPVSYREAINAAKAKGITINTIHAGTYEQGVSSGWKEGALLAFGNYMSIDHNHQIAHIEAPQDRNIAKLNERLNSTYVPYGKQGQDSLNRQLKQDENSSDISISLLSQRVKAKASSIYNNMAWDLVDALNSGEVDLDDVDKQDLPEPMQAMDKKEQGAYIKEQADKRRDIQNQIAALSDAREDYIAEEMNKIAKPAAPTINDALGAAIKQQGEKKNFSFTSK